MAEDTELKHVRWKSNLSTAEKNVLDPFTFMERCNVQECPGKIFYISNYNFWAAFEITTFVSNVYSKYSSFLLLIQISSLSTKGQIASKNILRVVSVILRCFLIQSDALQKTNLNAINHYARKQEKLQVISWWMELLWF